MRRLAWLMLMVASLGNLGCSLLPPQTPYDAKDQQVTSFRGGRYWETPGGFGPDFWSKLPPLMMRIGPMRRIALNLIVAATLLGAAGCAWLSSLTDGDPLAPISYPLTDNASASGRFNPTATSAGGARAN